MQATTMFLTTFPQSQASLLSPVLVLLPSPPQLAGSVLVSLSRWLIIKIMMSYWEGIGLMHVSRDSPTVEFFCLWNPAFPYYPMGIPGLPHL
jgi:hypothetical protein